ncbi:MAG: hypothetical protein KDD40_05070, partial [Bdellovibrionales bacterium]|nr:hypothetical protein [Bdellovibrionales bacterium]
ASLWAFTEGDLLLVPFGSYVWHHLLAKKSLKERQSLIPIIYSVLIEEVHAIFSRSTNDSQAYLPSRFSQRLIDKLKQSLE